MSFNWQQKGWPNAKVNRAALREELKAFEAAFRALKKALRKSQDPEVVARAMVDEAVKTSAIEGVNVDESVVMSSICRVLGVAYAPKGFARDARAEGVAQMMLTVREKWNVPISTSLLKDFHGALTAGEEKRIAVGAFRSHAEPMRVIRQHRDGTVEIRYEAPPSSEVPREIRRFVTMWKPMVGKPVDVALKAAMLHPHFESIHPFEDGNGRVGRALVAKTLSEGLGLPLILPVSSVIARHRVAYYDELNEASRSFDWTNWCAFFIPVLTEMLTDFVDTMGFIAAKRDYLAKYEAGFSERAKKVILRIFEDGVPGVKAGLSAAKWMRMAKVSKATASRDLAELEAQGAIRMDSRELPVHYRLDCPFGEPIETINGTIKITEPNKNRGGRLFRHETADEDGTIKADTEQRVFRLIARNPGKGVPYLKSVVSVSRRTLMRHIAALVKAGRIEHRGSKKTGGYWEIKNEE